jgi:hypothetical protein
MATSDSVMLGPLTAVYQNVWDLAAAKYLADGLPMFEKFCREWSLEAPTTNIANVEWSRTSLGNNTAGAIGPGESVIRQSGTVQPNENTYTLYVRGLNQYILLERSQ